MQVVTDCAETDYQGHRDPLHPLNAKAPHPLRISHFKRLLASLLNIKPIISVEKGGGTYVNRGHARTMTQAIDALADIVASTYPPKTAMRM